jgi:hypothetical protein
MSSTIGFDSSLYAAGASVNFGGSILRWSESCCVRTAGRTFEAATERKRASV